jgi:hypothetical protein
MPRADLHNALVIDREIYDASQVDAALLDPVIRPVAGLPGVARPFVVMRAYQGPQGVYSERFVVTDRNDRERYASPERPIQLTGEMFENRFSDTLTAVLLDDLEEHTATFYVDDEVVGSIPVFVEATYGGDPRVAVEETFNQALKKGTILWVRVPQPAPRRAGADGKVDDTRPVWFTFDDGKVFLIVGETEQRVPGLAEASEVTLIARSKDQRSQVAAVPAAVRVIPTDDDEWDERARAALPKRLNLPDGQDALARWRERCTLVELTPRFRNAAVEARASAAPVQAAGTPAAAVGGGTEAARAPAAQAGDDIHVEAEVDQEVYDKLIADGKSERLARAKAKAAFVRKERARIMSEREAASGAV